jgi:hypothetical protein
MEGALIVAIAVSWKNKTGRVPAFPVTADYGASF